MLNKNNWAKHDNVTTGILKLNFEHFVDDADADTTADANNNILENQLIESGVENTQLKQKYIDLINQNLNSKDLNNNVIKKLDDKITTYGQAISMNNYETNINNNLLIALYIVLAIVFLIFIAVLVYYNNLTGGKIKLIGM